MSLSVGGKKLRDPKARLCNSHIAHNSLITCNTSGDLLVGGMIGSTNKIHNEDEKVPDSQSLR